MPVGHEAVTGQVFLPRGDSEDEDQVATYSDDGLPAQSTGADRLKRRTFQGE